MILLVTGGRVATVDSNFVAQSLSLINQNEGPIKLLVHGDAKGIDRMWRKSLPFGILTSSLRAPCGMKLCFYLSRIYASPFRGVLALPI